MYDELDALEGSEIPYYYASVTWENGEKVKERQDRAENVIFQTLGQGVFVL